MCAAFSSRSLPIFVSFCTVCDSEVHLHPFACSQLAVPDPLAERTAAPLERIRMVKAIELGEGLGVSWVSPVPRDSCVAGSNVLYVGLRISCCSPGLDRSLWNLPRGSHDSGLRSGTGDRVREAIIDGQIGHSGWGILCIFGPELEDSWEPLPPVRPPPHLVVFGQLPACSLSQVSRAVWWQVLAGSFFLGWVADTSANDSSAFAASTEIVSTATI